MLIYLYYRPSDFPENRYISVYGFSFMLITNLNPVFRSDAYLAKVLIKFLILKSNDSIDTIKSRKRFSRILCEVENSCTLVFKKIWCGDIKVNYRFFVSMMLFNVLSVISAKPCILPTLLHLIRNHIFQIFRTANYLKK